MSTSKEEATPEEKKPDIKVTIENGKHVEVDFDLGEWIIVGSLVVIVIGVLAKYGVLG